MNLFVTGTDTDAGKTVVTAAIAAALRARGRTVWALKPLATGGPPPGDDATRISAAAGHPPQVFQTAPVPASPERAFQEAGITPPTLDALLGWIRAFEGDDLLVEGVGGWEVPLGGGPRVSDLAEALGYPVVVVAGNRLGVISHTLLTVEAIQRRGLTVRGVVLNDVPGGAEPPLRDWNLTDLRAQLRCPVLPFSQLQAGAPLDERGEALWAGLSPESAASGSD